MPCDKYSILSVDQHIVVRGMSRLRSNLECFVQTNNKYSVDSGDNKRADFMLLYYGIAISFCRFSFYITIL